MVRFEKEKVIIEIENMSPVETYQDLYKSILKSLSYMDEEMIDSQTVYYLCTLLEAMALPYEDLKNFYMK